MYVYQAFCYIVTVYKYIYSKIRGSCVGQKLIQHIYNNRIMLYSAQFHYRSFLLVNSPKLLP